MAKGRQRTSSRRSPGPSRTRVAAPGPAQEKERLPWRVRLRRTAITLLRAAAVGPPLLIFVYRIVPPPLTPLMLIRLFERSEEHTSELQPLMRISYAFFCLKKKHIAYT